jgi:SAM-dependent methyltransferase
MSTEPVRAGRDWLELRESADAAARSPELVEALRAHLPERGVVVHDLGCGTGSMARWLAPKLAGPSRWVLHDRDAALLAHASAQPPVVPSGARAEVELRCDDITRLAPHDLSGASLLTASAVLDMLTGAELDRFVATCARAGCPVLITLSVAGRVELYPEDPLDRQVQEAFNDHQRRRLADAPLLGPDAATAAVDGFRRRGLAVDEPVASRPRPGPGLGVVRRVGGRRPRAGARAGGAAHGLHGPATGRARSRHDVGRGGPRRPAGPPLRAHPHPGSTRRPSLWWSSVTLGRSEGCACSGARYSRDPSPRRTGPWQDQEGVEHETRASVRTR